MALVLVTAGTEPVTTQQLKDYMRVNHNAEDAVISSLGKSARAVIEKYLRRGLMQQTWKQTMDCFPRVIKLGLNPVSSITHVKYYDTNGVLTTLTVNTDYVFDLGEEPARIVPAYNKSWPTTRSGLPAQVEVQFVVGYGSASTSVPDALLNAIKELALYWYDNRHAEGTMPAGIRAKLQPYRLFSFYEG